MSQASASSITYNVDILSGTQSIVGTITTDGATGNLLLSDITAWDLVGTQTGGATVTMLGPNVGDTDEGPGPTGLVATATTLSFLFESTTLGWIGFDGGTDSDSVHGGHLALADAGDLSPTFDPAGPSVDVEVNSGPSVSTLPTTDLIGTAVTPLPAALPLFATGLGVMGLFGWRRKKKAAIAA